jgi:hypothetical protein
MKSSGTNSSSRRTTIRMLVLACSGMVFALPSFAQQPKKKTNPASKVYFTEVQGLAEIDTGDKVDELMQRTVYTAQGAVIETKRPETPEDKTRYTSAMVFSNGTGAFFDTDTRVEMKRFVQEPFVPNRNDIDVEPSISQTQAFVSRGAVGLCTSKLVAGSVMTYNTPHGSVNIRGRRVVIEAMAETTKISMLEGESTVRAGEGDMGGHALRPGQQAIIHAGRGGQPAFVEIQNIPPPELPKLEERSTLACAAKKTVYFEARERPNEGLPDAATDAPVTAFNSDAAGADTVQQEIVPVPIVPTTLPTEYTVSPATLVGTTPTR